MQALVGARVFDGDQLRDGHAVLIEDDVVRDVVAVDAVPSHARREVFDGGILAPGFVDLQVNGGGGAMLNDTPDVATMSRIAAAHRRLGTTALLPTLITATTAELEAAIAAAMAAVASVPGVVGLHLEGPHLAPARKGAHRAELMGPMTERDAERLIMARAGMGVLMVTLAPEQVAPALIRRLADAGVIVSLGHSDAGVDVARAAIDAGARCITHLFNAMSQLGNREPGLVGAALSSDGVWCGVIADGHHVHRDSLRIALAAKPGRVFLVSDAMATAGSDIAGFELGGRRVQRRAGRLELADGTLAGADIDLAGCVRFAVGGLGVSVEEALRMASRYPAALIGDATRGHFGTGARADIIHLSDVLELIQSKQSFFEKKDQKTFNE